MQYCQATVPNQKQLALDIMRGLKHSVKQRTISVDNNAYFSCWYHPVIRELVCLVQPGEDYDFLACSVRPPITAEQARESVRLLVDLGFVARDLEGCYYECDQSITTGSEVVSLGVRALNREMARQGVEAIDAVPPSHRDISSCILGVSRQSYEQIKQEIQAFKQRIFQIVTDDQSSDTVYNLNVQLFPVSTEAASCKKREGEGG